MKPFGWAHGGDLDLVGGGWLTVRRKTWILTGGHQCAREDGWAAGSKD